MEVTDRDNFHAGYFSGYNFTISLDQCNEK